MNSSAPRWERRKELWAYFALAFGLTWAVHIPLALAAKGLLDLALPPGLHFLGAAGPISAAFIVTAASRGASGLRDLVGRMFRWRVGVRWLLFALFSPVAFFLAAALLTRLFTGAWPALDRFGHIAEFPTVNWLAGWALWTVAFGFGEETGWRGFVLPRLQRKRSARSATLILGALWALWHLPSFFYNYPGLTPFGVVAFVVSIMSGALVLTWLYNSTGGSILVAALWHGAFNAATASGEGPMSALVSAFVILTAVLVARWAGPEDLSRRGKQTL
jgi:membrane protease YdiL (CAAX protease family)